MSRNLQKSTLAILRRQRTTPSGFFQPERLIPIDNGNKNEITPFAFGAQTQLGWATTAHHLTSMRVHPYGAHLRVLVIAPETSKFTDPYVAHAHAAHHNKRIVL